MPNAIAYLALLSWPVVAFFLFRKLPTDRALIITLLGGYLLLPEPPATFDFPLLPPFHKHNIPAFTAFACLLWMHGKPGSLFPQSKLGILLVGLFVVSPFFTVLINGEPVIWGDTYIPGLGMRDALALMITQVLLILPYLMARQHLSSGGSQRTLLVAFMVGGLLYTLPMLIEIRLSPQLNLWVYGFFQHSFAQTFRFGGWRPTVFLYHGLWVAFFLMTSLIAAWALWRFDKGMARVKKMAFGLYLGLILVMAKSFGAMVLGAMAVPLVIFLSARMQIKVAALIAIVAWTYPITKGLEFVPEDRILEEVRKVGEDKYGSLKFRFDNETLLLDRAATKGFFGWGSWGRNHIMDTITGEFVTIADGRWIITVGTYGWVGFFAEFGLLLLPILLLLREVMIRRSDPISPYIGPLTLIQAFNLVDMIPNATLTPLSWMISGALLGYAELLRRSRTAPKPEYVMTWKPILQ